MILALVGAIPPLLEDQEHGEQDIALDNEMADMFDIARRSSDFQERAKRAKFERCTMGCVSCNKEISGYRFMSCLSGCRGGKLTDNNCLRYLTKWSGWL